jgi:hypothetical protein
MTKPIWIIVDDGDVFEGHQGHWADCFFSNATKNQILSALERESFFGEIVPFEIREMTDEEIAKYPEAIDFEKSLIKEYGEA